MTTTEKLVKKDLEELEKNSEELRQLKTEAMREEAVAGAELAQSEMEWEEKLCNFTDSLFHTHLLNEQEIPRKMFIGFISRLLAEQKERILAAWPKERVKYFSERNGFKKETYSDGFNEGLSAARKVVEEV